MHLWLCYCLGLLSTQVLAFSSRPRNDSIPPEAITASKHYSEDSSCLVVVFGRPGAGKSTVAERALELLKQEQQEKHPKDDDSQLNHVALGLDLDVCVPEWMRDNFSNGIYPTVPQRLAFAQDCCDYVQEQLFKSSHSSVAATAIISFSFVNTDLRNVFRKHFPHARWILIDTSKDQAMERIRQRKGHFYKEVSGRNSNTKATKVNEDDVDNSDWKFAPVTFDHTVLDGTHPIDKNAKRVVSILKERASFLLDKTQD